MHIYYCSGGLLTICLCRWSSNMFHLLETASELWMNTPQKYSWAVTTPSFCTTHVRTLFWQHPSSWIWSSWQSSVRGLRSREVRLHVHIHMCIHELDFTCSLGVYSCMYILGFVSSLLRCLVQILLKAVRPFSLKLAGCWIKKLRNFVQTSLSL